MYCKFGDGLLSSNVYLVWNEADDEKQGFVLDFGVEPSCVERYAKENGITVKYLIYSHGHYDHGHYAKAYQSAFPEAILLGAADEAVILCDPRANVSALCGDSGTYPLPDKTLFDGDTVVLGKGQAARTWRVIHTPGHTPGSICLLDEAEKIMLTGDTLFADGGFGRYDFMYGDVHALAVSLARLLAMDGDVTILPGHSGASKIKFERETADFVASLV